MSEVRNGALNNTQAKQTVPQLLPQRSNSQGGMKQGRRRPPTTGEFIGLAAAKRALVEAGQKELELKTEKELAEEFDSLRVQTRSDGPPPSSIHSQAKDVSSARVERHADVTSRPSH